MKIHTYLLSYLKSFHLWLRFTQFALKEVSIIQNSRNGKK